MCHWESPLDMELHNPMDNYPLLEINSLIQTFQVSLYSSLSHHSYMMAMVDGGGQV